MTVLNKNENFIEAAKSITCMIPDDGTDIKLMQQLKNEMDITRVQSQACRGVTNMQSVKTKSGKLPEPVLFRYLTVVVDEEQADDVFGFIHRVADIGKPGRGILVQTTLLGATSYSLPENVVDETNQ